MLTITSQAVAQQPAGPQVQPGISQQTMRPLMQNQKVRRWNPQQQNNPVSMAIGQIGQVVNFANQFMKQQLPMLQQAVTTLQSSQQTPEAADALQKALPLVQFFTQFSAKLNTQSLRTNTMIPLQQSANQ